MAGATTATSKVAHAPLDALVAVVRELGQLTGVPTPFTEVLLGLSRLQARTLGLY